MASTAQISMVNLNAVLGNHAAAEYAQKAFSEVDPENLHEYIKSIELGRSAIYFVNGRGFVQIGVVGMTMHIMAAQHWGGPERLYCAAGMATLDAMAKAEGCMYIEVRARDARTEPILSRYGFVHGVRYVDGATMLRKVV